MMENVHSYVEEEERNGDSGTGGQKLMELLNSQLQNAVKMEERYNHMKRQYDAMSKAKAELEERNGALKKQNENLDAKIVEVLNEKKEMEDLHAERMKRADEEKQYLEDRGVVLAKKVEEIRAATDQLQLKLKETETNLQNSEAKVKRGKEARKQQKENNRLLSEENVRLREEARWAKENNERTLREFEELKSSLRRSTETNNRVSSELADSKRANEVLQQENKDLKAKLESDAESSAKLWALLGDIKNMKSNVQSETESTVFSSTMEEQRKKIKELKKQNKELKEKVAAIVTNITERLSKPTSKADIKLLNYKYSHPYISATPQPDPSSRIFSSMNNYFNLTPTKRSASLPTTPAKVSSPYVRPMQPNNDLLLLDYLEKKDTPVVPTKTKSGLSSSTTRRELNFNSSDSVPIKKSKDKEKEKEQQSEKQEKGKEKEDKPPATPKKKVLLDDYIDMLTASSGKKT